MLNETHILGVKVNFGLTMPDVLSYIQSRLLVDGQCHTICTTNPEMIMSAQKDIGFRELVNKSSLSIPDGIGVILAIEYSFRFQKYYKYRRSMLFPLIALGVGLKIGLEALLKRPFTSTRLTGVSLFEAICQDAASSGKSLFLLGGWPKSFLGKKLEGAPDLAQQTKHALELNYPGINIVGATSAFSRESVDDRPTLEYIRNCMRAARVDYIDILLVAYNHGYQEKWIARNASQIPARVSIGVGGAFYYAVGIKRKSPDSVVQRNLDWLFRLFTQPWRVKRVLTAFPMFPLKVFISSLK